jgi:hypothetical protein
MFEGQGNRSVRELAVQEVTMAEPLRSAKIMADKILADKNLLTQLQTDPAKVLRETAEQVTRDLPTPAFVSDVVAYRIVVTALGLVCVAAIGGAIYLSARATGTAAPNIPDVLTALGAAAIGALAGLLAPSPSRK